MNTRIQRALADRRDALRQGEKGFTLIELLVVIIIIGILAAIAIPVYIGFQNNAKDSAAQTDATNLRTAVLALQTQNSGTLPTPDLAATKLSDLGSTWTNAGGTFGANTNALAYKKLSATTFCISATSSTGSIFKGSDSAAPVKDTSATPAGC